MISRISFDAESMKHLATSQYMGQQLVAFTDHIDGAIPIIWLLTCGGVARPGVLDP